MANGFPFWSEKHGSFSYIGLEVSTLLSEDGHKLSIYLGQKEYIDSLQVVPVDSKPHDPLDPNESTLFRSLLGKLMWISGQTRPDIAYKVCNRSIGLAFPRKNTHPHITPGAALSYRMLGHGKKGSLAIHRVRQEASQHTSRQWELATPMLPGTQEGRRDRGSARFSRDSTLENPHIECLTRVFPNLY